MIFLFMDLSPYHIFLFKSPDGDHPLGPSRDGKPVQEPHPVQYNQVTISFCVV